MRTCRVSSRFDHVLLAGIWLIWVPLGVGALCSLIALWKDASLGQTIMAVVACFVAVVGLASGHHHLFRSPVELRVSQDNVVHFVSVAGSQSIPAANIESLYEGVAFRLAGWWMGAEGMSGLTVVHRTGVIAAPCAEPRRLARFLTETIPDIQMDDVDDTEPDDGSSSRSNHSVGSVGFLALPCIIGAAVVFGINFLPTFVNWPLSGWLSTEDFRRHSLMIWVGLSVTLIPFVLVLGWATMGVLKVATAIRHRRARRRKIT